MFTSFDNEKILTGSAFQVIKDLRIGVKNPNRENKPFLDCVEIPLVVAHFEWNGFISLKINNITVEKHSVFYDFGKYGCVIDSLIDNLHSIKKQYNIKDSKEIELVVNVYCERNLYRVTEKAFHDISKHAFFNYDDVAKSNNKPTEETQELDLSFCSKIFPVETVFSSFSNSEDDIRKNFAILTENVVENNNLIFSKKELTPLDVKELSE